MFEKFILTTDKILLYCECRVLVLHKHDNKFAYSVQYLVYTAIYNISKYFTDQEWICNGEYNHLQSLYQKYKYQTG